MPAACLSETEMSLKNKPYCVFHIPGVRMVVATFGAWFLMNSAIAQNKDVTVCNVIDLKMLALTTNDEQVREKSVSDWLTKFGKACATDQLVYIRGNLAPWLGTANTLKINQSIENILTDKKTVQKNYDADTSELEKNKANATANKPATDTVSTRR